MDVPVERAVRPTRVSAKHVAEYALLRCVYFAFGHLPRPVTLWCARRLGDFAFDLLRLRRRVTLANLELALGERLNARARAGIARRAYRNIGMTFAEFVLFGREPREAFLARTRVLDSGPIAAAARAGQGVIYLTAHTGNWENFGLVVGLIDGPLATIIADQRNPLVDRFVKEIRSRTGSMLMIPRGSALRGIMRTLQAGGRVGIAGEQDAGQGGVFLPLFGRLASTAVGPARFAYRTGAPIVVGFDRHAPGGRHEIELHPPIVPDRTRPEGEEMVRMLTRYNALLEGFVERYPDQWFWMHRRWKTRPPGERAAGADRGAR
jgi:KDO2-lipid IV(A) lauroyltransferase